MDMTTQTNASTKKCPYCAESIKAEALRCRYCQAELRTVGERIRAFDEKVVTPNIDGARKLIRLIVFLVILAGVVIKVLLALADASP